MWWVWIKAWLYLEPTRSCSTHLNLTLSSSLSSCSLEISPISCSKISGRLILRRGSVCGHECWVTWRANAEGGSVCYECWVTWWANAEGGSVCYECCVKQWANAEGGIVYGHEWCVKWWANAEGGSVCGHEGCVKWRLSYSTCWWSTEITILHLYSLLYMDNWHTFDEAQNNHYHGDVHQ